MSEIFHTNSLGITDFIPEGVKFLLLLVNLSIYSKVSIVKEALEGEQNFEMPSCLTEQLRDKVDNFYEFRAIRKLAIEFNELRESAQSCFQDIRVSAFLSAYEVITSMQLTKEALNEKLSKFSDVGSR